MYSQTSLLAYSLPIVLQVVKGGKTFYESFKQINGLKKDFKWTLVTHIWVFGTFNSINTL